MNWAVEKLPCCQAESSAQFQYRSPGSFDLDLAGHRKQTLMACHPHYWKFHTILWNSQSPLSSMTWNVWCANVIGFPAFCRKLPLRAVPPKPVVGWRPSYRALKLQTIQRRTAFNVLWGPNRLYASQVQRRNRLYRTLFGRQMGMFIHKHINFSFLYFVKSCAASP